MKIILHGTLSINIELSMKKEIAHYVICAIMIETKRKRKKMTTIKEELAKLIREITGFVTRVNKALDIEFDRVTTREHGWPAHQRYVVKIDDVEAPVVQERADCVAIHHRSTGLMG